MPARTGQASLPRTSRELKGPLRPTRIWALPSPTGTLVWTGTQRPLESGRKTLSSAAIAASVSRVTVLQAAGGGDQPHEAKAVTFGLINLEGSLGGGEREGGFQELFA